MSGEFDSRKDLHSRKFAQRPQIFVKLSFRELCDSKLSDLHLFDKMVISSSENNVFWTSLGQLQSKLKM